MTSTTGSAPSTLTANLAYVGTLSTATAKATMAFGVVDASASYGIPSYKNTAVQQADLSMLTSTGAQCVRVDVDYAPWLPGGNASLIQLLTSVAKDVRSQGRCLIISDAGSESYRNGGCLDWAQFKVAWVQRVSALATLFHPKYYIVIKEPGWYVPMVCDAATNPLFQSVNDWLGLTQNLTNAVLTASPSTQVGVAIAAGYTTANPTFYIQYLNEAQMLSGISFIGFDIYSQSDQATVEHFLYNYPPSKPIWIAEAWSNPAPTTQAQAQSDAQWMKSFYSYAQSIKAKMLIPFYTDLFSGYTVPTTSSALITFYHGRTPVYTEFHNVVAGTP
ncbi:MAG: hypothetical protein OK454_01435 [Thaumarchaeota archaeon]|nr:hypothetical protein [Nitrososphaerota archaeon]